MTGTETDYAVPTGEFILEWLEDNEMSCAELARRTGFSAKQISLITRGLAPVTPEFAERLALVTRISSEHWLALESLYQSDKARLALEHAAASRTDILASYKPAIKHLRDQGWIQENMRRPGKLLMELMAFFQVGHPDGLSPKRLMPHVAFLQSGAYTVKEASVVTWLHLARIQASTKVPAVEYTEDGLRDLLPNLRSMSRTLPENPVAFVEALRGVGVNVVILPEVSGCRTYGATFWEGDIPIIALSARGKRDGTLWFSLFHEIGHVLLHPNQTTVEADQQPQSGREEEANTFAVETLIPPPVQSKLRQAKSLDDVRTLARAADVSPGVLLQHMQHNGIWPYDRGNDLYVRLTFAEEGPSDK